MTRKVIIDCDPGIDDAVALCIALFDPKLEVVAITAAAGNVTAAQATCNVQAIVEQLDPPRFPRIGAASISETCVPIDTRDIHGDDGLGNAIFSCSQLHHQHLAEKVICDEVRAAPEQVTILCLGPLTNIAKAFQRDPALPSLVGQLVIMGGAVRVGGNITAAAEFNMYCDSISARKVFHSATTKTLVPLDVTRQVALTMDFIQELPPESTRAGKFLRRMLPFVFRAYHQKLGQESIYLHDVVALLAVTYPEMFHMTDMPGDIETSGELTTGATIFDRRPKTDLRPNMEVALEVDVAAAKDCIIRGIQAAGRAT